MNHEELHALLLPSFLSELGDGVSVMRAGLVSLQASPRDPAHLKDVFRMAHTLRGAAGVLKFTPIIQVCRTAESTLAHARDGTAELGSDELALLSEIVEALADARDRLLAGGALAGSPVLALSDRLAAPSDRDRVVG